MLVYHTEASASSPSGRTHQDRSPPAAPLAYACTAAHCRALRPDDISTASERTQERLQSVQTHVPPPAPRVFGP